MKCCRSSAAIPADDRAGPRLSRRLLQEAHESALDPVENPGGQDYVLATLDLDEMKPLMVAPRNVRVVRDASSLAQAMSLMLRFGSQILFVDPYYDPFSPRYQCTLRECLRTVKSLNPRAACEIHHRHRDGQPLAADFEREAKKLFESVIPAGMTVTIYRWREKPGGEDFQARYLLTNKGGISVEAGFSAEGVHQNTDMSLLDFDFSQAQRRAFDRDADVYDLVEPILQIARNGYVEHV